jgi:hypothetical protein
MERAEVARVCGRGEIADLPFRTGSGAPTRREREGAPEFCGTGFPGSTGWGTALAILSVRLILSSGAFGDVIHDCVLRGA